jgi:hypothetical protein
VRLYGGKDKIFPEMIQMGGEYFAINADFRNILRILALIKDKNVHGIKKIRKICEWFFESKESEKISGIDANTIIKSFGDFVNQENAVTSDLYAGEETLNQGQNGGYPEIQQFCYEFDGEEIYVSFLSEYNIDLIDVDFLHWYKFRILLSNLSSESAFKKKIALRFLDLSMITRGKKEFSELLKIKESIQLPYEYSDEEERELQDFRNFWEKTQ